MLLLPEIYIILLSKILLLLSFLFHFPFILSDLAASFFLTFPWPLSLSLMLSGWGWSGAWRYGARWRGVLFSLLSYSLRMTGSFIDKYELQGLAALSLRNIKPTEQMSEITDHKRMGMNQIAKTIGIHS